jgi:[acyl-carrier-protein] S-malonyltransferase
MGQAFAEAVKEASDVFDTGSEASGLDLRRLCFEGPLEELTETARQQPALVTATLACLAAVRVRGIEPDVVVGHSVGEYSALSACGALSEGDAIALVTERGRATAAAAAERRGAMAAIIGLDDASIEAVCADIADVWPANYNSPGQVVVSGTEEGVERLIVAAQERGARRAIRLAISGGFHSPLVASAAERIRRSLQSVSWREPAIPFLSTVTARIEPGCALPGLLVEQLTAPVRFTQSVRELVRAAVTHVVEIGPGSVLSGLVRRCDPTLTTLSVGDPASLAELEEVLARERDD